MMDASDDHAECRKKRKRNNISQKLLVGDKVEVRSLDEGSMGSWHSAVVISLKNRARDVQYDFLVSDDGSRKLIEQINVHPIIDGVITVGRMRLFYRGVIRPLPPPLNFDRLALRYGQCVDAYYQEAWWEGVIFDHENDAEIRYVFFPDMGDVMCIGVEHLRITQDWDEYTEEWKPRGNWLFIELIEKFKRENLIHVSVREIWYEVSEKQGFGLLKEWTNSSTKRYVWENLVMEVIFDHSNLAAEMFFGEFTERELEMFEVAGCTELNTVPIVIEKEIHLDDPLTKSSSEEEGRAVEIYLSSSSNSVTNGEGFPVALSINHDEFSKLEDSNQTRDDSDSCVSDKPIEKFACQIAGHDIDMVISSSNSGTTHEETPCNAQSIVPCNAAAAAGVHNRLKDLDGVREESPSDRRRKRKWEIAGPDIVPEAEFCPNSVDQYLNKSKLKYQSDSSTLSLSLRKHLVYLGWKIEVSRDDVVRMRYTSPDGIPYMSLVNLCKDWNMVQHKSRRGKEAKACAPPSHALISSPPDIVEPAEFPEAVKNCAKLLGSRLKNKRTSWVKNVTPKDVQDKAKRHLAASGWSIWTNEVGKKNALRYTSPSGKTYCSLAAACKAYREGEINYGVEGILISEPRRNIDVISGEAGGKLIASERLPSNISIELAQFDGSPPHTCNSLVPRKGRKAVYSEKKKKKEKKHVLPNVRNDNIDGDYTVNCSKRPARQLDSSSSFRSPLTILTWLIDNDVVLPRTKVYYRGRKLCVPIKEGLITREGIKCNCCKNTFGLSKFQAHAGSIYQHDRPASNIYLEDGRSLLSCQIQLRNRFLLKEILTPSPRPKRRNTNDSICSVCHFGGLLVMCDHCPSSFHRECLGLKDIPDGEWFCSHCCCGICGNNKFNPGAKKVMENSVMSCYQCEGRYHVGCLLKQGDTNINSYSEGKWFCNRKCEQIFLGLQKLLERPVVVGEGNLTWTLLKYIPRNDGLDGYDTDPSVETYSKLNLVRSVMHECFEPMNEPGTKRDIVEDVIFSKGSDLSRLNFQGFYTVVLSRDDELITVAAVRVHGEKVAEVPLVATRFQYRKLGMCRFLMDELEKQLMELGVEKLVMPAAPSVLSTWTGSFGFSEVMESERFNLRNYTFLDFQGAVMLQKILTVSAQVIRTLQNIPDDVGGTTDVTFNKGSSSDAFQAEQTEVETVCQGTSESAVVVAGADGGYGTLPLILRVDQRFSVKGNQSEVLVEERDEGESKESNSEQQPGSFRCYKRRRLLLT